MVDDISKADEAFIRSLEESPEQRRTRMFGAIPPRTKGRQFLPLRRVAGGGRSVVVTLASGQSNPVSAGPINFTVTFSEPATGFANADVSFTGSTTSGTPAAAVTGTNPYNVAVTGMTGNGTLMVTIPAGSATSTATGVSFPASNSAAVVLDTTAPTVTINQAVGQADPASVSPITFTVAFSESVIGFLATDVSITGTAGGTKVVSLSGGGASYSAEVTGMTTSGTVIAGIAAGVCTDLAGNANALGTSSDATVTWALDSTAPTVAIAIGAGQSTPTSTSPIVFDVVFSESVTGFATGDISFTGTTAGGTLVGTIAGSGTTYTVSTTGMTTSGDVVAGVPAGVAADASSNLNLVAPATATVVWEEAGVTVPVPVLTWDTVATDLTPTLTINFDENFCHTPITGSNFDSLTLEYSTDIAFGGSPSSTFHAIVLGDISTGHKSLTLSTLAQATWYARARHNHTTGGVTVNSDWSNIVTRTLDTTSPSVTINQAVSQTDPTSSTPILFTVTFSESVTGFVSADVTLGGTVGGTPAAAVSGSGAVYTVSVSGMGTDGTVIASIAAGVAADAAGNTNLASTSTDNTVTWEEPDITAPGAPTLDLVSTSDTGALDDDDLTNDTTPDLDITFASIPLEDDVLDLYDDAVLLVSHTITALEAGNGILDLGLSALSEGSHPLTATHTRDGSTSAISATLTITIDTTAPTISTAATANNNEGDTLAIALAADEDVTWSLSGGADQARFEISGTTLRWLGNGVKDFETPDDTGANNTYVVDVRATDTAGNTTDKTITVTVINVSEGATNREIMLSSGYAVNTSTTTRQWQAGTTFNVEN